MRHAGVGVEESIAHQLAVKRGLEFPQLIITLVIAPCTTLALAAPPSPLASQKIAPQRRKIAPCLWLAVAPGQLAWLLAEGLGSLQDGLPTWLRRAWPQRQLRMHGRHWRQSAGCTRPTCVAGARSMSGHPASTSAWSCYSRFLAAAAMTACRRSSCKWFTWMALRRCDERLCCTTFCMCHIMSNDDAGKAKRSTRGVDS